MSHSPARTQRLAAAERRHGGTLLTVLAFSVVTLAIGASILSAGSYESRNAQQRLNSQKAFWLAEAGFQKLSAESYASGAWLTANRSFSDTLNGGSYSLTIRDTTVSGLATGITPYHVIATGSVAGYNASTTRSIDMLVGLNAGTNPYFDLGAASPSVYGLLAIGNADVTMSGGSSVSGSVGSVGVLNGNLTLSGSSHVDATAYVTTTNAVTAGGSSTIATIVQNGTTDAALTQASYDAIAASAHYAALAATNNTKSVSGNKTFTGAAGQNVVNLTSVSLSGNKTITFDSPSNSTWVVNCSGAFSLQGGATGGSKIVLTGGITPSQILWNVTGDGSLSIATSSIFNGIVLAPSRATSIGGGSVVNGALLIGGTSSVGGSPVVIDIAGGSVINGTGGGGTTGSGLTLLHWLDAH